MGYDDNSNIPGVLSTDDARREYENALRGGGLQNISIQRDKDGNSRVLGFKIPKELLPAVETVLPNAILWLQRTGSQFSYDKALWLANKAKFKDQKAQAVAKAAELGVRWGLIGIKPITDAVFNVKTYAHERKELFKEFKPVIDATGVNYRTNEVIRNAFDELHGDMVTNMKLLSADALTLAPIIYVGVKDQRKANAKERAFSGGISERAIESLRREEKELADREAFIKRTDIKRHGKPLSPEELGTLFDEHKQEIDRLRRHQEEQSEHAFDRERKTGDMTGEQLAILGLSLGSQIIKTNIRDTSNRRSKGTNAWKMIQHLKEEMDEQAAMRSGDQMGYESRSAEDIYVNTRDGRMNLRDYIIEVFQQHERDRMAASSKMSGEAVQKLNPLGPALVERLTPAVDTIAEYIADGRLNPYALVNLVGDNQVIIHKPNGARSFASQDNLQAMIDSLVGVMSTKEEIKPEEFFANFADPALIQHTLAENLKSMQGREKSFFVALFPDEILEQAGMKKKEIIAHRKEAHQYMYDVMTASVLSVAAMDAEALKKLGLSEKEINTVQTLAEKIEAGDEQAIKTAVDGHDKTALAAIRTAGLNEQVRSTGDGANFWTKMVDKARSVPQLLAERKDAGATAQERESRRRDTSNEAQEIGV